MRRRAGKHWSAAAHRRRWGLGVLTYVLLTGRQPFSSPKTDDPMVVMRRIVDDAFAIKFPPYVSPAAKELVLRLLERKPSKRLGMLQARMAGQLLHAAAVLRRAIAAVPRACCRAYSVGCAGLRPWRAGQGLGRQAAPLV